MDTAKLYIDTANGLIDNTALAAAASVLVSLVENQDELTFSVDEHGHFFEMSADTLDKFRAVVDGPQDAKPKRGRPRKVVLAPEAEQAAVDLNVVDEEIVDEESIPDLEE
jgi:hypothetical protein